MKSAIGKFFCDKCFNPVSDGKTICSRCHDKLYSDSELRLFWDGIRVIETGKGAHTRTGVYRWQGVNINGYPEIVEAWCSDSNSFEPCPNFNVKSAIKKILEIS